MKLLKFKFKNLFSLGEGEIELQGRGLTLVTGYSQDEGSSNGAGKSSLANKGIVWTLFGGTVGGLRADAALNRHTKKKCFGEIEFEGKDGDTYRIRRERPAKLLLFKGNQEVSAHKGIDTQVQINSLLGFDFKTFVQTSCFGQGRKIHYPELPPKDQKAVLEQILPMEEVDRWVVVADLEIKNLKPKIDNVMGEYRTIKGRCEALQEQLSQAHEAGESFERGRIWKKEQAENELKQIEQYFIHKFEVLNTEHKELQMYDFEQVANELAILAEQLEHCTEELIPILKNIQQAELSRGQWQTKLQILKTQLAELNKDTKCPVCLRDYDDSTKQAITDKVEQQKRLINNCVTTINECEKAKCYYEKEQQNINKKVKELTENKYKKEKIIKALSDYDNKVNFLKNEQKAKEAETRANINSAVNAENPHIATVGRLEIQVEEETNKTNTLLMTHQHLNMELEHLIYWRDIYGKELKLKLFEDTCPFLDARTTYYLERLQNKQIHCEFSTVKRLASGAAKEEFTVRVWSETGGDGFESLSGGEQQMVSFAISLALADLASSVAGSESGFLILDEPFTELDDRNGEAVVEYLTSEIQNGKDTILFISNDKTLKGLIPNRIHVIKSRGITNVCETNNS